MWVSNSFNTAGQLTSVQYSDTTPAVSIAYDRLGRQTSSSSLLSSVLQSSVSYAYDSNTLALDTETITIDPDGAGNLPALTRVLDRSTDTLGRQSGTAVSAVGSNSPEHFTNYGYDKSGRLSTVTGPAGSFTYTYTPNSSLIASVTGPVHTVTNTWEPNRDVLDVKDNRIPSTSTPVSRFGYGVNGINQRTQVQTTGTAFPSQPADWNWGYDALGQVITADSPTSTFDRAYEYDQIGNRKKSADSLTLPTADNYTANNLNQYTAVNAVNPVHDLDGNATSYPLPVAPTTNATLAYDGENRLVSVTTGTTTVSYTYDAQSRRIARLQGSSVTLYLYDAWNCLAEYSLQNSSFTIHNSFSWGLDLSGSLQGAGGVGGLLSVTKHQAQSTTHYFPTYDGNGNISEYLTAAGTIAAHYEYDPFGRTIVATGPNVADFAYRFSTKPRDPVAGLYYYGYRWFDPYAGRWPSRDPIEEDGGVNLYGFVGNSGLVAFDFLGMKWKEVAGTLKTSGPWQHQTTRLNVIDYSAPPSVIIQLASNQLKLRYSANGTACCENTTTGARKKIEDNRYKEVNAAMGTMLGTFIHIDLGKSPKDFLYDSVLDVADPTTKGKMVAAATKLASVIRANTPALGDPGDGWETTVPSPQGHGCARLDILHP